MRVLLVNMPWASVEVPSLALGILRNSIRAALPDVEVEVRHANLDYVDWVTGSFDLSFTDYQYYAVGTYFSGNGDWVFSAALYDDPKWRLAEFHELRGATMTGPELAMNVRLHELAPEFVRGLAESIVAAGPDVVGFTTTFQQNTAALAAARQLKALDPRIVTVFGGANCDGPQGEALHRNFGFVDFVLRGEAEATFPQLLSACRAGDGFAAVPGLCWRRGDGSSAVNPMSARPLPPAAIVAPDYDGYFDRLAESVASEWAEPRLVAEGARGCWWGEKHHCTFCGLNGSTMEFRSKRPERFFAELLALVERHQVLDVFVVDNILDMGYLNTLLPALAETGYDLRMLYEIKSNMRFPQLETLAAAGLADVQPGIESLDSRVLRLMDKGVTGCQNVRLLRDAGTLGLTVSWNYLYGFPGETDADYEVIDQVPALHHLYPPEVTTRIAIERFSPYFNSPELGFAERRPADQYGLIYDLPDAELADLAYLFTVPPQGIGEQTADRLRAALDGWKAEYPHSRLTYCELDGVIVLVSRRRGFDWTVLRLDDPVEQAAFRLLHTPHTAAALTRKLAAAHPAADVGLVTALLRRWRDLGLVFAEGGQFVQIAVEARNQELLHIDPGRVLGREEAVPEEAVREEAAEPAPAPA
jgi:ribosomal peptide maturation radical SAM protein 1